MNKVDLRKEMKQKLQNMTENEYWHSCHVIKEQLINSKEWIKAKTIGITISTGREVDTKAIIEAGWQQNKRMVVPKCFPKQKELKFYQINSFTELEDSFYGLKEPIISITPFVPKQEIELLIVPGIIFDSHGYRIGYGGGYYDRFLVDYQQNTIALAFGLQIINEVPFEAHDIAIERIITTT